MKALTVPPASRGAGTRRRTPLLAALAGLAVLIAGTIATVSPASAATSSAAAPLTVAAGESCYGDSYVSGCGYFSWTVSSAVYTLTGSLTVACAIHGTEPQWGKIAIDVEDTSGTWRVGTWHTNNVCDDSDVTWSSLTWTQPAGAPPIKAWEIKVQREGGGIASGNQIAV